MKIFECTLSLLLLFSLGALGASDKKGTGSVTSSQSLMAQSPLTEPTPLSYSLNRGFLEGAHKATFAAPQTGTELLLGFNQSRMNIEGQSEREKNINESNFSLMSFGVFHAINSVLFVGGRLNYGSSTTVNQYQNQTNEITSSDEYRSRGIGNPQLTVGGRLQSESLASVLTLSTYINTGDNESTKTRNSDDSSAVTEDNSKIGGSVVIPSITLHTKGSSVILGATYAYAILSEKTSVRKDSSSTTRKYVSTGGNIQHGTIFLEKPSKRSITWGGSLEYSQQEEVYSKSNGVELGKNEGYKMAFVSIYGGIPLSESFQLTPVLTYGQFDSGSDRLTRNQLISFGLTGLTRF